MRAPLPVRLLAATGLALGLHGPVAAATLERGNGPEPSTLDAHKCQEVACGNILRDLYEGLVTEDAHGRIVPGMASCWTTSADGRTWTFHLRPGLRWSDGSALDAAQIVASFRRAFAPATAAPFAELFDALARSKDVQAGRLPPARLGVEAPDAHTVVFRLDRSADLPALLTLPIAFPVHLPSVAAHGAQHTRPGRLRGNGAYRLRDWTPQANLVVERNPHFHAARTVAIDRVRFHVTEDAAAELQRFAAGDLHVTEAVPPQPLGALRARFGDRLRLAPYLGAFWLGFNTTRAPFAADVACGPRAGATRTTVPTRGAAPVRDGCIDRGHARRRALSMAIDRDRLVRHVTGFGEAPAYGIVPPGIAGYRPAATPWSRTALPQRIAQARLLLRAAGHTPRAPLEIELRYNTSTPHRRLALAVAAMWRQAFGPSVRVRLRNEEWKVFVGNRKQRVITQVFRGGWIADVPDPRNFLVAFAGDGPLNWTGYHDAGFRDRLARADAARTAAARNAWLHAAEMRLLQADAVIPLYFYTSKHLVDPRLRGFAPNALDRHASRWLRLEGSR
jgi:oligopeptide transport system substrate-binding protein